jgi:hypothetical protein
MIECLLITETIKTLETYYLSDISEKNETISGGNSDCHNTFFFVPVAHTVETVLNDIDNVLENENLNNVDLHLQKILLQLIDFLDNMDTRKALYDLDNKKKESLFIKLYVNNIQEQIKKTIHCMDASDVPDQHISCFPIEILREIRDAFNLQFPEKKFLDDNRSQIVHKLRQYTTLTTDDEFLTLLSQDKEIDYLRLYLAPPQYDTGDYAEQFEDIFRSYERKYTDSVYIVYNYVSTIPNIKYHAKYKKDVEAFIREQSSQKYRDNLPKMFSPTNPDTIDKYDHVSLLLVLLYMLRQENIRQIIIDISCEGHATCVYIHKNDKNGEVHIMHYNSARMKENSTIISLRNILYYFLETIYKEKLFTHNNAKHQFLDSTSCLVFSLIFAIHMLNPNISLKDKFAHFEKEEDRNIKILDDKCRLLNKNIPFYLVTEYIFDDVDVVTTSNRVSQRDLRNDTVYYVQSKLSKDAIYDNYYACRFKNTPYGPRLKTYAMSSNSISNYRYYKKNPHGDTKENINTLNNIVCSKDCQIKKSYFMFPWKEYCKIVKKNKESYYEEGYMNAIPFDTVYLFVNKPIKTQVDTFEEITNNFVRYLECKPEISYFVIGQTVTVENVNKVAKTVDALKQYLVIKNAKTKIPLSTLCYMKTNLNIEHARIYDYTSLIVKKEYFIYTLDKTCRVVFKSSSIDDGEFTMYFFDRGVLFWCMPSELFLFDFTYLLTKKID